jgi:hypothetical protein
MSEFICRNGCAQIFSNSSNRHRHEIIYCKKKKNNHNITDINLMQQTITKLETELLETKNKLSVITDKYILLLENFNNLSTEVALSAINFIKSQ